MFFPGSKRGGGENGGGKYTRIYGPDIIAGYSNGYFSEKEEPEVAQIIANSGAQLLFVAITSPKKEKFLYKYAKILKKVNFTMGVGGTFDIIAGVTKRAPKWVQDMGMEWIVRLTQEPGRMWKRYLVGNTMFVFLVIREKIQGSQKREKTIAFKKNSTDGN